jgi:hypothetical protein
MFRRNIASAIADLTLWADGNGKTGSTVATVGENPSAKGRLPDVYLLTKIPLIYYDGNMINESFTSVWCF